MSAAASTVARDVAWRLRRLSPSHRDPERFHIEKDALARRLELLARRLEVDHG